MSNVSASSSSSDSIHAQAKQIAQARAEAKPAEAAPAPSSQGARAVVEGISDSVQRIKDKISQLTPGHAVEVPSFVEESHFDSVIDKLKPHPSKETVATVNRILDIGVQHARAEANGQQLKMPGAEYFLDREMEDMSNKQKDALRDAIVSRMSSPETSQIERDVLQRMYNHVDKSLDQGSLKPFPGKPFPRPIPFDLDGAIEPTFPHPAAGGGGKIEPMHPHPAAQKPNRKD